MFIAVQKNGVVYLDVFIDLMSEYAEHAAAKLRGEPTPMSFAEAVIGRLHFLQLRARMAMGDIMNVRTESPMTEEDFTNYLNALAPDKLEEFLTRFKF